MRVRGTATASAVASLLSCVLLAAAAAHAQTKAPQPQGVKLAGTLRAEKGFFDDAFAFDGPGGRLAVVRTDAAGWAEIEVLNVPDLSPAAKLDISKLATGVSSIAFVGDGSRLFIVGRPTDDEDATGYLLETSGKVVRKWGPATDVMLADLGGETVVTTFRQSIDKKGNTVYELATYALATGKRMSKKTQKLVADQDGFIKSLDLTLLYWRNGYTQLVGKKKGEYDKLKDQRMNDGEAIYDLVGNSLLRNILIQDVIEHTRLSALRAQHQNMSTFVHVTEDLKGVELVTADDKRVPVKLAEAFHMYEATSLQWELGRDGIVYFTLTIDPVNPEAVNRKKQDPEVIDLYRLDPAGGGAATRLARLPKGERRFGWRHSGGTWAVLRKHKGFGRGGGEIEVHTITAAK